MSDVTPSDLYHLYLIIGVLLLACAGLYRSQRKWRLKAEACLADTAIALRLASDVYLELEAGQRKRLTERARRPAARLKK